MLVSKEMMKIEKKHWEKVLEHLRAMAPEEFDKHQEEYAEALFRFNYNDDDLIHRYEITIKYDDTNKFKNQELNQIDESIGFLHKGDKNYKVVYIKGELVAMKEDFTNALIPLFELN